MNFTGKVKALSQWHTFGMNVKHRKAVVIISTPTEKVISVTLTASHGRKNVSIPSKNHTTLVMYIKVDTYL